MPTTLNLNINESYSRIGTNVRTLAGMLRAQRDLLAQRGLDIGKEAMEGLNAFAADLDKVTPDLIKSMTELDQLRELARTTQVTSSGMDVNQVLSDVIDTVITLTKAERGYIVLKNPETEELEFKFARNMRQADLTEDELIVSRTVVARVAESGQAIVSTNAQEDPRFAGSLSIAGYMLRSILCVPLIRKGLVIGVIYADNRLHQGIFGAHEEQLVSAFANQAAIAIENVRLFEQLRATLADITAIRDFMDNVFASIGSGVITTDRQDAIQTLNRAAAKILDVLEGEAARGQPLMTVFPPMYDGFERLIHEVRDYNRTQAVEVEPVLSGRGQVNLNLKLSPFKDSHAETQGVAIVLDDLTAVKQQQAQLSVLRRYLTPAMLDNIQTIAELELGGVEREISVISCDVRGFTSFSERIPPEQVMAIVNRYMTVSSDAIHEYSGIIDKFMGDAVVGLFNTQLNTLEDHAERAVLTALRMVEKVRALHESLPPEQRLSYGIGVHTGLAILGNVGSPSRKEFTAIGETLEFAKLLQENCQGGEIMISTVTYERVSKVIKAEPALPRKMKETLEFSMMYQVKGRA